jgi:hypothetical protein
MQGLDSYAAQLIDILQYAAWWTTYRKVPWSDANHCSEYQHIEEVGSTQIRRPRNW